MSDFCRAYGMKKRMAKGGRANKHDEQYGEMSKEESEKHEYDSKSALQQERHDDKKDRDLGVHNKKGASKKEHYDKLKELKKSPKPKLQGLAEGGKVGGASTSTTGNKTKTGGSNPGGASTGGAGTVTITTGKIPPKGINISNVGGSTTARNAGGMDPSDEEDDMMMADGGSVLKKVWDYVDGGNAPKPPPKPTGQNTQGAQILGESYNKKFGKAEGGEIMSAEHGEQDDDHMLDMVGRAMARHQQKYSEGGKVANGGEDELSHMADGKPNNFDDLSMRDDLEFNYTGDNSGDHLGNEQLDEDNDDVVSKAMKSRAKKDRLPKIR